jgi:hypothetical protein
MGRESHGRGARRETKRESGVTKEESVMRERRRERVRGGKVDLILLEIYLMAGTEEMGWSCLIV